MRENPRAARRSGVCHGLSDGFVEACLTGLSDGCLGLSDGGVGAAQEVISWAKASFAEFLLVGRRTNVNASVARQAARARSVC